MKPRVALHSPWQWEAHEKRCGDGAEERLRRRSRGESAASSLEVEGNGCGVPRSVEGAQQIPAIDALLAEPEAESMSPGERGAVEWAG